MAKARLFEDESLGSGGGPESKAEPTSDHLPEPEGATAALENAATSAQLLLSRIGQAGLDPSRRIFVNRTLRLDPIDNVGFDMDYSLVTYKKRNLEELSFKLTVDKLIQKLNYPPEIAQIAYDPQFVVRGLVVDKTLGNIFKMDLHCHVGRVYHGRRLLTKEERRALYRNVKIRLKSRKYHWIDTLFALPEAALYADIIDLLELQLKRTVDYWQLFDDIRNSIDECHRDGSLKAIVTADLERYIEIDPDLPHALHKLRSSGKRLFVLTNSYWEYTRTVMTHILEGALPEYPSWENYFDYVIVGAEKPRFFTEDRPFHEVEKHSGRVLDHAVHQIERRHVYQGGSLQRLENAQAFKGERVLYVGDHIYGDVIRTKKSTLWRTALILVELEDELKQAGSVQRAQAELLALEERLEDLQHQINQQRLQLSAVEHALDDRPERSDDEQRELSRLRRQLRLAFDGSRRDLRTLVEERETLAIEIERCFNPYWGSVFKEGAENSGFGRQVEDYACIYTSRVSNFRFYSPNHYFQAPRHWMAHEKG